MEDTDETVGEGSDRGSVTDPVGAELVIVLLGARR
jgi:hypothetical protein